MELRKPAQEGEWVEAKKYLLTTRDGKVVSIPDITEEEDENEKR